MNIFNLAIHHLLEPITVSIVQVSDFKRIFQPEKVMRHEEVVVRLKSARDSYFERMRREFGGDWGNDEIQPPSCPESIWDGALPLLVSSSGFLNSLTQGMLERSLHALSNPTKYVEVGDGWTKALCFHCEEIQSFLLNCSPTIQFQQIIIVPPPVGGRFMAVQVTDMLAESLNTMINPNRIYFMGDGSLHYIGDLLDCTVPVITYPVITPDEGRSDEFENANDDDEDVASGVSDSVKVGSSYFLPESLSPVTQLLLSCRTLKSIEFIFPVDAGQLVHYPKLAIIFMKNHTNPAIRNQMRLAVAHSIERLFSDDLEDIYGQFDASKAFFKDPSVIRYLLNYLEGAFLRDLNDDLSAVSLFELLGSIVTFLMPKESSYDDIRFVIPHLSFGLRKVSSPLSFAAICRYIRDVGNGADDLFGTRIVQELPELIKMISTRLEKMLEEFMTSTHLQQEQDIIFPSSYNASSSSLPKILPPHFQKFSGDQIANFTEDVRKSVLFNVSISIRSVILSMFYFVSPVYDWTGYCKIFDSYEKDLIPIQVMAKFVGFCLRRIEEVEKDAESIVIISPEPTGEEIDISCNHPQFEYRVMFKHAAAHISCIMRSTLLRGMESFYHRLLIVSSSSSTKISTLVYANVSPLHLVTMRDVVVCLARLFCHLSTDLSGEEETHAQHFLYSDQLRDAFTTMQSRDNISEPTIFDPYSLQLNPDLLAFVDRRYLLPLRAFRRFTHFDGMKKLERETEETENENISLSNNSWFPYDDPKIGDDNNNNNNNNVSNVGFESIVGKWFFQDYGLSVCKARQNSDFEMNAFGLCHAFCFQSCAVVDLLDNIDEFINSGGVRIIPLDDNTTTDAESSTSAQNIFSEPHLLPEIRNLAVAENEKFFRALFVEDSEDEEKSKTTFWKAFVNRCLQDSYSVVRKVIDVTKPMDGELDAEVLALQVNVGQTVNAIVSIYRVQEIVRLSSSSIKINNVPDNSHYDIIDNLIEITRHHPEYLSIFHLYSSPETVAILETFASDLPCATLHYYKQFLELFGKVMKGSFNNESFQQNLCDEETIRRNLIFMEEEKEKRNIF